MGFINDEGEYEEDGEVPLAHKNFIAHLKNYLLQNYLPVKTLKEASFTKSTQEVFNALQRIFPSLDYSIQDVAVWLHEGGYTLFDMGEMRFEWLLKEGG